VISPNIAKPEPPFANFGTAFAFTQTVTGKQTYSMKTFLRDMATRQYFQSVEKWTLDREDAYDFGLVSKAMKIAHKLRIPDLELVLSLDEPEQAATTPLAAFLRKLSQPSKHRLVSTGA
jgi:hypothetical protein